MAIDPSTKISDLSASCVASYKPDTEMNGCLRKLGASVDVIACERFHHFNLILLKNPLTDELGIAMSGSDNLHNWLRNAQYGLFGSNVRNIVKRIENVVENWEEMHGIVSWLTGHSAAGHYLSRIRQGDHTYKVFFNGANVEIDEKTIMLRMPGDPATKACGQSDECLMLSPNGGGHSIKTFHEVIIRDCPDLRLAEVANSYSYGNRKIFTYKADPSSPYGDGPEHSNSKEYLLQNDYPQPKYQSKSSLRNAVYKRVKNEMYQDYKRDHPKRWDSNKNRPIRESRRIKLKAKADKAVLQDPEYLEQLDLLKTKREIDDQIANDELEVVDSLPESATQPSAPEQTVFTNVGNTLTSYFTSTAVTGLSARLMRRFVFGQKQSAEEILAETYLESVTEAAKAGTFQVAQNVIEINAEVSLGEEFVGTGLKIWNISTRMWSIWSQTTEKSGLEGAVRRRVSKKRQRIASPQLEELEPSSQKN